MSMLRVGVIGYGYWGPNLVRNFNANPATSVVAVADRSEQRLLEARRLYPALRTTVSADELIDDTAVDVVAIATPVGSHFPLAMAALRAGKHVLVEKPITSSSADAMRLIEEAQKRNLVLMVDHTFLFAGAVRKMRELTQDPSFGRIHYYDSTRVNLGLFQHDVNVLWDLAVHDLSIMEFVLQATPRAVSATAASHVPGQPENTAFLTVFFDGDLLAHINVNWLSPVKIRRTLVGGSQKMIVFDDLEATEKIKVYDKGITVRATPDEIHKMLIGYRTGDLWSPNVPETEALRTEVEHFVQCVNAGATPISGGEQGVSIVRILEAADESIKKRGAAVDLKIA